MEKIYWPTRLSCVGGTAGAKQGIAILRRWHPDFGRPCLVYQKGVPMDKTTRRKLSLPPLLPLA